jgi:hypothetical protein
VKLATLSPLYVRIGDVFAYACALFGVVGVIFALWIPEQRG